MPFIYGIYSPFKNISLMSSRKLSKGGRKSASRGKHMTFREQTMVFSLASQSRFEPTSALYLKFSTLTTSVCMYSNSRNDVPRVAQRYGTIAAHTRRRAPVLVVLVVFCVHMYSFAGSIRRTPSPTFSDTAITRAPLIPLFSSSELTGCGYPCLLDRKYHSDTCSRWESNPRLPACKASTLSTRPVSPLVL